MYRLNHMKEALMCCVERQMNNLDKVDAKELGEAIDMIKDLEEAIYYCTITEAMNNPQKYGWGEQKEWEGHARSERNYYPMMYYPNNGDMYIDRGNGPTHIQNDPWDSYRMPSGDMSEEKEGRSGKVRRQYMDSKMMNRDKTIQMKDLEKYMQELSADIIEMIDDATPEEKQYLSKKISGLAEKVGKLT